MTGISKKTIIDIFDEDAGLLGVSLEEKNLKGLSDSYKMYILKAENYSIIHFQKNTQRAENIGSTILGQANIRNDKEDIISYTMLERLKKLIEEKNIVLSYTPHINISHGRLYKRHGIG